MRWLTRVSVLITALGALLFAAALAFGLGPVWALGGLLLVWTGIVKVVVVLVWRRVGVGERPHGIFEP